jgi:quercetin dioxygenase-like cupin family protein
MAMTGNRPAGVSAAATEAVPGLWRTDLQRSDLSLGGREVVQTMVTITPESVPLRHSHPGEEIIYVVEGSLEYALDGEPAAVYHAGQALTVPPGVVHSVRNVGESAASELATYVVEKDQPLLQIAD